MRKSPEERLFGRNFGPKLPNQRTNPAKARKDIMEAKYCDKRVHVQARRSHGEVERPSRYLEKTNSGAGNLNREGRGREVQGRDTVVVKNKAGGAGRQGIYKDKGAGRHDQDQDSGNAHSEGEDSRRRAVSDTTREGDIDSEGRGHKYKA